VTPEQLQKATGCSATQAAVFAGPLTEAMLNWGIRTPEQQAAFVAQVAHESGRFVFLTEIWGPTPAQSRYDLRADLGNTLPQAIACAQAAGDRTGHFYRGRGLIQLTGYSNYRAYSLAKFGDDRLVHDPAPLAQPELAADSAGWFWNTRGCNDLVDDYEALTRRINGGLNGYEERLALFRRAQQVFEVPDNVA
jgi:putative chitinase